MTAPAPLAFIPFVQDVLGVTLEDGQRVFWRVAADGVDPVDLDPAEREIAAELFGPIERVPPSARRQVAVIKGADVGFSFIGGLRLLHRALTATELGAPGEIRPALAVAPDLRLGRIPIRNALGAAESVPAIAAMIETSGADGFVIRREGGRRTSVECLPATAGGRALRGRRDLEVLFDEGAFFRDAGYAVNDVDCERAVLPRCLGTFWNGSTPWLESASVWKTFEANFGHPTTALAARMPTLLVRSDPRVVELVTAERERDPEGAATEYDCVPPAGGGGFYFDAPAVNACADPVLAAELAPVAGCPVVAGFDPAFQRDASAGVVLRRQGRLLEVVATFERRPTRGAPLVPSEVVREFAEIAKRHGARAIVSDVHYQEAVREALRGTGVAMIEAPAGHAGKAAVYAAAREAIHGGAVRWSAAHFELTRQLRDVVARPSAGGLVTITSPRRKGAHGDLASAFVLAVHAATRARVPADPATLARNAHAFGLACRALVPAIDGAHRERGADGGREMTFFPDHTGD